MLSRSLIIVFFICVGGVHAQDKLFYKNGTAKKGIIISIGREFVFFRKSDTSAVEKVKTSVLLLTEDYKGNRHVFAEPNLRTDSMEHNKRPVTGYRNSLGVQPFALFFGRATVNYERLNADEKIGYVIPFSLTFDPSGVLYNSGLDTNSATKRIKGVNFITGLDVNFYLGRNESSKFFIGPRIRYGTDLFLRRIEAYTLQTQIGWRLGKPGPGFVQHFSFGFGFARIVTSPAGRLINPKQSYAWYSINYRVGVRW